MQSFINMKSLLPWMDCFLGISSFAWSVCVSILFEHRAPLTLMTTQQPDLAQRSYQPPVPGSQGVPPRPVVPMSRQHAPVRPAAPLQPSFPQVRPLNAPPQQVNAPPRPPANYAQRPMSPYSAEPGLYLRYFIVITYVSYWCGSPAPLATPSPQSPMDALSSATANMNLQTPPHQVCYLQSKNILGNSRYWDGRKKIAHCTDATSNSEIHQAKTRLRTHDASSIIRYSSTATVPATSSSTTTASATTNYSGTAANAPAAAAATRITLSSSQATTHKPRSYPISCPNTTARSRII